MKIRFLLLSLLPMLAFSAFSSPVKSDLGADGEEFMGEEWPTAADYVQEGLVAMWDGIENAGWGEHDSSATVWKDLVGIRDFTLAAGAWFDNNSLFCETSPYATYTGTLFSADWEGVQFEAAYQATLKDSSTFPNIFRCENDRYGFFFERSSKRWKIKWYGDQYSRVWSSSNDIWFTYCGLSFGFSALDYAGSLTIGSTTWIGGHYVLSTANEKWEIGGGVDQIRYLNGKVHCIRVYNRQLTPTEIQYNAMVDKIRFDLP